MLRSTCPICGNSGVAAIRDDLQPHPYLSCTGCNFWYQYELKPKVYEASHEVSGDLMSQSDKTVNRNLATWLRACCPNPKSGRDFRTLDIGAKYPYLAHCFGELGAKSHAIDGIPEINRFSKDLNVKAAQCDFENDQLSWPKDFPEEFDLITMIHMIEHLYQPMIACDDVYSRLAPGGHFFIRCPSNDVPGIERDFSPGHFDIHPQIWGKRSLELMAEHIGFEVVLEYPLQPGQRDTLLRKPL